ncbi:hypothetical protein F2Q68_00039285 [Brassica cretica]|uniref:Uncharacterized protein n=2 Tax=Brassica cretica TaxID=69181 RepID=A0ABQ7AIZ5_BRACR|nr:hypothetical protein F2Q68_00039285 [Brassica cretica]KAF3497376.1 hypothetical protein DY000_02052914 [Brassica cretica]
MTNRLKTYSEQPDRTHRPLDDHRVVRASNNSTIVEWSARAGHSTIVEWSEHRTTRRSASYHSTIVEWSTQAGHSTFVEWSECIEPLDDRRVIRASNHSTIVEWSDHQNTQRSSSGRPKQVTR